MKKRAISVITALCLFFACVLPCFAVEEVTPLVIVTGMNTCPLTVAEGENAGTQVFPPTGDTIMKEVSKVVLPLFRLLLTRDWDTFCDSAVPAAYNIFEPVEYTAQATSKHSLTTQTYTSYAENTDPNIVRAGRAIGERAVKELGGENVFVFVYDWRDNHFSTAEALNGYIDSAMQKTGAAKVDLVSISMGGVVTSCYLQRYGYDKIENLTLLSPAFKGVGIIGDLFTGNVAINTDGLLRYLAQTLSDSECGSSAINTLLLVLDRLFLFAPLFGFADSLFEETYDEVYEGLIKPVFGSLPGLWQLVPADKYPAAREFMLDETEDAALLQITDRYFNDVAANLDSIYRGAVNAGVKLAIILSYGRQGVPVYVNQDNQHDGVIDSMYTSGGATFAKHGKVLGKSYVPLNPVCANANHHHLSPDGIVDASTAMFPEYTWFIKNFEHVGFEVEGNSTDFIMWLTGAEKQFDVREHERYPQFMVYSNDTHILRPLDSGSYTSKFVFF